MTPDTIAIIATVILAAVGVIAARRNEITDIRSAITDIRSDIRELRTATNANTAAIGELRGLLTAHITGHSHPAQQPETE